MFAKSDISSIKGIMSAVESEKAKARAHIFKVTTPLTDFEMEMALISRLADLTQETVKKNSQAVKTEYNTQTEIVAGLRGETNLYFGEGGILNENKWVSQKGWVPMKFVSLNGFELDKVFPPESKFTPVEFSPDKGFVRATYGFKGEAAKIRYFGEYVPYTGRFDIFCFTHFSPCPLSGLILAGLFLGHKSLGSWTKQYPSAI